MSAEIRVYQLASGHWVAGFVVSCSLVVHESEIGKPVEQIAAQRRAQMHETLDALLPDEDLEERVKHGIALIEQRRNA
jgi:hypothetical protein